ncbi:hypothetical protein GCM10009599_21560 [Luteococcus peritonei]
MRFLCQLFRLTFQRMDHLGRGGSGLWLSGVAVSRAVPRAAHAGTRRGRPCRCRQPTIVDGSGRWRTHPEMQGPETQEAPEAEARGQEA